ncbi:Uncharacterized protein OS=Chloracidobacterium thermophilum (strain B) GN=Cabther_B0237 PE=4 SV=1 [Gemmata massiliana]|uniref:Quinol:cytochrome C oxidoreductase n=1 Tax=Gemmata massiliana TaxID=1210884 RepID=A0A6P2CTR8_9BACT|nr:hypothetical protein [Gemmata massiliana]VTR92349.1 Uncharacterized protein OS=Chloracidobacterium thermophilum (strain B) GN=Cabther_B0237 PE=4 SV=1 [Gemmata massiliana]
MSSTPAAAPPAPADQPDWSGYTRVALIMAVVGWVLFAIVGFVNYGAASSHAVDAAAKVEKAKAENTPDGLAQAEAEKVHADDEVHDSKSRFMVAYLSGFTYWLSLPVGALALLMIRYVAKTSWGLLLTRPFEAATRTLPLTILLFLPIVGAVAYHDDKHEAPLSPYWWSSPAHAAQDSHDVKNDAHADPGDKRQQAEKLGKLHLNKAIADRQEAERKERDENIYGYLSVPGFVINSAIVFGVWGVLIFFLNKWGKETSDATDPRVVDRGLIKLQNISGPGLILFAIITTSAATQWTMSLEPGWSSTMFPVIFSVNTFLTTMAFGVSMFLLIADRPPFRGFMRPKFQLDMATLMLVFTLFWSYTSFSQFMLVWIGNLPEEIPFYLKRSNDHGHRSFWWFVSAALIALHFALPFVLLLFRNIKLHPKRLRIVALYLMVICAVDVIWWVAPSAPAHGSFPTYLMDVGAVLGVGGVWLMFFVYQLKQRPIFPDNQAFLLPEGHHHEQH